MFDAEGLTGTSRLEDVDKTDADETEDGEESSREAESSSELGMSINPYHCFILLAMEDVVPTIEEGAERALCRQRTLQDQQA